MCEREGGDTQRAANHPERRIERVAEGVASGELLVQWSTLPPQDRDRVRLQMKQLSLTLDSVTRGEPIPLLRARLEGLPAAERQEELFAAVEEAVEQRDPLTGVSTKEELPMDVGVPSMSSFGISPEYRAATDRLCTVAEQLGEHIMPRTEPQRPGSSSPDH